MGLGCCWNLFSKCAATITRAFQQKSKACASVKSVEMNQSEDDFGNSVCFLACESPLLSGSYPL